ncbi:MAG TPA: serine/threonine-protein kinase [Planctomycetota bacterium]
MANPPAPNPQGPAESAPAAAAPAKKTRRLGDYELTGKLGQGAMGSVYLATQLSTGRKVAIKILPQEMARDQEFLERFRREARAASRISHANVVAAYDVGFIDNHHYIAMEFIDGPNLEIILQKKGRFPEQDLFKLMVDIASALEAAEAAKTVHRDIKPANILMNSQGVCKLTDMGLASASQGDQRVTMAGFAVGTPYYISPEQARGDLEVDCRADIYSFGATLYHLATGTLPFPGANPVIIMTKHLQEMPPPPTQRCAGVSPRVSAMIMKMMSKDPKQRYQSAAELKADAERCLSGQQPLLGAPPPRKKAAPVPAPAKPAAPEAGSDEATPALPHPAVRKPLLDRLIELPDTLLPFLPPALRMAVCAGVGTAALLAGLFAAIKLLK